MDESVLSNTQHDPIPFETESAPIEDLLEDNWFEALLDLMGFSLLISFLADLF